MHKRTPIRIANGKVYAWIKHKTKSPKPNHAAPLMPIQQGDFYLAQPKKGDVILHEPWGKSHVTHMATPKE